MEGRRGTTDDKGKSVEKNGDRRPEVGCQGQERKEERRSDVGRLEGRLGKDSLKAEGGRPKGNSR